ncbi:MAG: hypothetical protein KAH77_01535 [Thiomargarita sp.]|nr:hypothetical protein [Thiomargarita sp.]
MSLSSRLQLMIGLVLATLLVLTRSQHFADLHQLPAASWAAFFLAGLYIQSRGGLFALLGLTFILDFSVFLTGSYSACFTPAYMMLLPAYASLWLVGRWFGKQQHDYVMFNRFLLLGGAVFIATLGCELLSSGGYYLFSGQFDPSFSEFSSRLVQYYPYSLTSTAFYVTIATLLQSMMSTHSFSHAA